MVLKSDGSIQCRLNCLHVLVSRSHLLAGKMHQCHAHWRQFGMNAPFIAALFQVSPHKASLRQLQGERHSVEWVSVPVCLEEVATLSHTQSESAWATELSSCLPATVCLASNGKLSWKHVKKGGQLLGCVAQIPTVAGSGRVVTVRDLVSDHGPYFIGVYFRTTTTFSSSSSSF